MTDPGEAEFVILGGRLRSGAVGYANDNGDFVPFDRARRWSYEQAMARARDLAASIRATVFVAPLLFGLPDIEVLDAIGPDAA